jgi:hypothetical protein
MSLRLAAQLGLTAVVLQGCALRLATEILDPQVSKSSQVVDLPSGRPVQQLRATVSLKNAFPREIFASLIAYRCGGDHFIDAVGAGTAKEDTAEVFFSGEAGKS